MMGVPNIFDRESMSYKIILETQPEPDGTIRQMINRQVVGIMRTQDQQIREALIALGWTPPPEGFTP